MVDVADRAEVDAASVDAIIGALYETVSGPAGERDFDRLRPLFLPGARMIPTGLRPNGDAGLRVMDCEEWFADIAPFLRQAPFYEVEVARRTERFGPVVHALSTYEARRTPDGDPFMRGINSIQLLHADGRWWVVTIFWANETPERPIPECYLETV